MTVSRRPALAVVALWAVGLVVALSHGTLRPGAGDFVRDFYPAARQALHGYLHYKLPPYTPADVNVFRYPPFAAVLFAPLALFSVHTAATLWWVAAIVMVAVTALIVSRLFPAHRGVVSGVLFLGMMAFAPIGDSLRDKADLYVLALVAGAIWATRVSVPWRLVCAGALIGVAIAIKVYPVLALIAYFVARPPGIRWIATGCVGALIVTSAIAAAVVGLHPFHEFATLATTSSPALTATTYAFSALNIAARLFTANPYAPGIAHLATHAVDAAFAVYALAVFVCVYVLHPQRWALRWSVALAVGVACSPFLEDAYLASFALVAALLFLDGRYPRDLAVVFIGVAVCFTLVAQSGSAGTARGSDITDVISVLLAVLAATYAWRKTGAAVAAFTGGMALLVSSSLPGLSVRTPPISTVRVIEGSVLFWAVLVVLASVFMLARGSKSAIRTPQ